MANPQKENGFTPIAHEILEKLGAMPLSTNEFRVLLLVLRETYGRWDEKRRNQKKENTISGTYMAKITGLKRQNVHRALASLIQKKVIYRHKINSRVILYGLQKNWDLWKGLVISTDDNLSSAVITKNKKLSSAPMHSIESNIKIEKREFPCGNSDFDLTRGEKSILGTPLRNPIEGRGPQCPTRIGVVMAQLLKKELVGDGKE